MKIVRNNFSTMIMQAVLMAGLGVPGVLFIPVLLRYVDHEIMATIFIAQVFVYYLLILVNFGLDWSSPAEHGQAQSNIEANLVWVNTFRSKLTILIFVAAPIFCGGYFFSGSNEIYLLGMFLLLLAGSLNSNWLLNARKNFHSGIFYTYAGLLLSAFLLFFLVSVDSAYHLWGVGGFVVLIIYIPQIAYGFGTWISVRRMFTFEALKLPEWKSINFNVIKENYLLVGTQLMQLMSATLGTLVVSVVSDNATTTAYAVLEKFFNLAVSLFVSYYMAKYSYYSSIFIADRRMYWLKISDILMLYFVCGVFVAIVLYVWGDALGSILLTAELSDRVSSIFIPFSIWLGLSVCQNVLTGHYIFMKNKNMVFLVNVIILFVTCSVGYAFVLIAGAVTWVYGLISGQLVALVWLLCLFSRERGCE